MIALNLTPKEACDLEESKEISFVEQDVNVKGAENSPAKKIIKCDDDSYWNYQAIHTKNKKEKESKVKVALIDSGVDLYNDIKIKESINLIPGEEEVLPLFWDISGHGTSIAGIIAAEDNEEGITGIASNVELYSARVLDENKSAPVSRIIEAIYWAIEKDVDIISISFGTTTKSEALEEAIKEAYNRGILIIAATGNNGEVEYPAAMQETMAVGGTDTSGEVCNYSGQGKEVEVVAPAEQIVTTGGFDGIVVTSGTSMAVPHVVGVAAKLWGKDKTKSADFIRQLLDASANGKCGKETECGYGIIDYKQALKIYKKFEKNYKPNKDITENSDNIEKNKTPKESFEGVDCVNGSWYSKPKKGEDEKTHLTLAENALNKNGYTGIGSTYIISLVKQGAVYPDKDISKVRHMKLHPCMHGYFKDTKGNASCNYINNYIACTKFAKEIRSGKTYKKPKSTDANNISKELQLMYSNVAWGSIGSTAINRAAFVYGVAIHTATDVFAHSVYGNNTDAEFGRTGWMRFFHDKDENGNDYADKSYVVPKRFEVAKDVAVNALSHFKNNTVGTANDFCKSANYNKNLFKLFNFKEYLNGVGAKDLAEKMGNYSLTYK